MIYVLQFDMVYSVFFSFHLFNNISFMLDECDPLRKIQALSVKKMIDKISYTEGGLTLILSDVNGVIFLDCIDGKECYYGIGLDIHDVVTIYNINVEINKCTTVINQFCACSAQPGQKCESGSLFSTKMPAALLAGDCILARDVDTMFY